MNKLNYKLIGYAALFNILISYGLSPFILFHYVFCLTAAITVVLFFYFFEIKPYLASIKDAQASDKQSDLEDVANMLSEMDEVIKEYEAMLTEQVVQLPCNCGKPLFEGILIPNAENICVCPSCKEKYKVMVSYDSILMSDETRNHNKKRRQSRKIRFCIVFQMGLLDRSI
jgi:hypothetical protein